MRLVEAFKEGFAYGWNAAHAGEVTSETVYATAREASDTKDAQDAIDASLTLLENPTPGLTVTCSDWLATYEPGPCRNPESPSWFIQKPEWASTHAGAFMSHLYFGPILRAAVQSGQCVVTPGGAE